MIRWTLRALWADFRALMTELFVSKKIPCRCCGKMTPEMPDLVCDDCWWEPCP